MDTQIPTWAADIIARLERIELHLSYYHPSPPPHDAEAISATEAMAVLGYKSRKAFWKNVRRQRIPYTRINARNYRFPHAALLAWAQSRTRNVS